VSIDIPIRNINRTVGTMLSNQVAQRYGHEGLAGRHHSRTSSPDRPVKLRRISCRKASRSI
jgi:hypothetical protein